MDQKQTNTFPRPSHIASIAAGALAGAFLILGLVGSPAAPKEARLTECISALAEYHNNLPYYPERNYGEVHYHYNGAEDLCLVAMNFTTGDATVYRLEKRIVDAFTGQVLARKVIENDVPIIGDPAAYNTLSDELFEEAP